MAAATTTLPIHPPSLAASRDDRTQVALAVQLETKKAVEWVKSRGMMNSSEWANPLAAAPSAVSTMAILLKTASTKVAAGIRVHSTAVKGKKGETLGNLPHNLLHTNLQACSDLGRDAFLNARTTMDFINKIALGMIQDDGKLEHILKMLDDPEDARDNLVDEMDDVKEWTNECLEKIKLLTDDFQYWYWVICCLKNNVLEGQGTAQHDTNETERAQKVAETAKVKHASDEKAALKAIKILEEQLEEAKARVVEAQAQAAKLENLPPIQEPALEEELLRAEKAIPMAERKLGILGRIKEKMSGESNEDFAARQAHIRDVERRRTEHLEKAKKQRDEERQHAERTLKAARDFEASLQNRILQSVKGLKSNRNQLAAAKANLDKTESQFKHLDNKKAELADILMILIESSRQLNELKERVQELVKFFQGILNDVNVTVEKDVKKEFLRPIEKGARMTLRGELSHIQLSEVMQKKVRDGAFRIQGSFSAIRDITGLYVTASDRYIRPAINKMEALSVIADDEWYAKSEEFTKWCRTSMDEIEKLTESATEDLEASMMERIERLQLAIEPAH
ncbi:hypothetical protein QBC35DRAFT_460336 [Podospora australis]|uniref:Uncharacterized protein n=1 Tax=Podospora australis TaxID=1536484 RepID=A0AAN6X360_9PEZI|nr:hypothetical protein QBC35DRAFT_460336 [Podospora australis]